MKIAFMLLNELAWRFWWSIYLTSSWIRLRLERLMLIFERYCLKRCSELTAEFPEERV